jgi:hypothetical protein
MLICINLKKPLWGSPPHAFWTAQYDLSRLRQVIFHCSEPAATSESLAWTQDPVSPVFVSDTKAQQTERAHACDALGTQSEAVSVRLLFVHLHPAGQLSQARYAEASRAWSESRQPSTRATGAFNRRLGTCCYLLYLYLIFWFCVFGSSYLRYKHSAVWEILLGFQECLCMLRTCCWLGDMSCIAIEHRLYGLKGTIPRSEAGKSEIYDLKYNILGAECCRVDVSSASHATETASAVRLVDQLFTKEWLHW